MNSFNTRLLQRRQAVVKFKQAAGVLGLPLHLLVKRFNTGA